MERPDRLERLPMTMGYFRLILRCFGDSPEKRRVILEGTGVRERDLRDPSAEISLFQQVRQVENVNELCGTGWAFSQPELWNPTAHGALGVAILSAPTLGDGLAILKQYAHVRAPFFNLQIREHRSDLHLVYKLTTSLSEEQWRPMIEISYVSVRALLAAALGRPPHEVIYRFSCCRPAHAESEYPALGKRIEFGARVNTIVIPKGWTAIPSALADASLFHRAVADLKMALERLENPRDFRARVERLLRTMPDGRLNANAVAQALGVSRRTLARRLQSASSPFRTMLDAELRTRAERMLVSRTMSRSDMADALGYRDPTSFSRACRRWFPDKCGY
jgi:AraC-like DNA-binding protein